jgi:hypothetical protein
MKMDRRTFLKLTSASGFTLANGSWMKKAYAENEPYAGPFLITFHASGGWDQTLLCDPKGRVNEEAVDPVNNYFIDDITQVGNFDVAPVEGNVEFFERFKDKLLVINGIDNQTLSHETGTRHIWCGSTQSNAPSLTALAAAAVEPQPNLAFLTYGGYDRTAGLVGVTRIPDANAITEIAFPDQLSPSIEDSYLFNQTTRDRLSLARTERFNRLISNSSLPHETQALNLLLDARSGDNELAQLVEHLPVLDFGNDLYMQAQVAMACFKAGVTVSANLSIGGFDTHGDHDASHEPTMQALIDGVNFAWDEAERQGIADQVIFVVGSDFGRTPWYNEFEGKDHWQVASMMMMGPGITGNRVIGGSDPYLNNLKVDPATLAISESGTSINPGHIHAALRELLGVDESAVSTSFNVGDSLPFFI